jgi:hypothetical protein
VSTPLHEAASRGDAAKVKDILTQFPEIDVDELDRYCAIVSVSYY